MNTDGSNLKSLGRGYRPSWSRDSRWLAYMVTDDDGHQYLNAEIFVIRIDGTHKTNITAEFPEMAFNPDWSKVDNQLVFNTIDGKLYKVEIELPQD